MMKIKKEIDQIGDWYIQFNKKRELERKKKEDKEN